MKYRNLFKLFFVSGSILFFSAVAFSQKNKEGKVFKEKDGFILVEAEDFTSQSNSDVRKWYVTNLTQTPAVGNDSDESHASTASGSAYIEILPDTRTNHSETLINGENFVDKAGTVAVVSYKVKFKTKGRYYVWAKAHSTGSEDNGMHVGIDGQWPESGKRMQWCEGKKTWFWDSKQRTQEKHCGEPFKIFLDIETPGIHEIQFSMREDGFEMDKWLMTTDKDYNPRNDAKL